MKYYVLGKPIKSSITNKESIFKEVNSFKGYGFQTLEDINNYVSENINNEQLAPIYEIDVDEASNCIVQLKEPLKLLSGEEIKNVVTIDADNVCDISLSKAFYNGKVFEYVSKDESVSSSHSDEDDDSISFDEQDNIYGANHQQKLKQEEETKRQQERQEEAQRQQEAIDQAKRELEEAERCKEEARRKQEEHNREIAQNEQKLAQAQKQKESLYQQELKRCLEKAKVNVNNIVLAEELQKQKIVKRSFYFKITSIIAPFVITSLLIGVGGGFPILADLLLQMGFVISINQATVVGLSLLAGLTIPATLVTLYYVGVVARLLCMNEKRTEEEKYMEGCNELLDRLNTVSNTHFKGRDDSNFIRNLIEIDNSIPDSIFDKYGSLEDVEKQPNVNRYQFLQFEYKALQEVSKLRGKVRLDKESEILEEAKRMRS
ncbi:MAG: hypothetical protein JSS07_00140 [Proteobacteria bacterium]|nr:hypothetical protein [Pseudomonadota bacterium]